MKKPSYNWREVLQAMQPGVEYTYNQILAIIATTHPEGTPPNVAQFRGVISACGFYLQTDKTTGRYSLTDVAINVFH